MKRLVISTLIVLMLTSVVASAANETLGAINGTDWVEWDNSAKYSFVSGYIAASSYVVQNNLESNIEDFDDEKASAAYVNYVFTDGKKTKNNFSRKDVGMILYTVKNSFNIILSRYTLYEITNGQIVEGLNALYSDFKNKQIKLKDAIHVVKKQVKGSNAEEIEAVLQYLRAGKDSTKLMYVDKNGKSQYTVFP